jgi:hypothetical protein
MQTRYCEEDRRDCATVERFFSLCLHPKEKHLTYFCLQAIDCLLMKPIEVSFSIWATGIKPRNKGITSLRHKGIAWGKIPRTYSQDSAKSDVQAPWGCYNLFIKISVKRAEKIFLQSKFPFTSEKRHQNCKVIATDDADNVGKIIRNSDKQNSLKRITYSVLILIYIFYLVRKESESKGNYGTQYSN